MKLLRIEVADAKRTPVPFCEARLADSILSRFVGLQFRASLPPGEGLLLVPGRHIHTMCMRFPIDVVRIDATGRVIGIEPFVEPWRISVGPPETHAILELAGATARIYPGDWLRLADPTGAPPSLQFLTGVIKPVGPDEGPEALIYPPRPKSVSPSQDSDPIDSPPAQSQSQSRNPSRIQSAESSKPARDSASKGNGAASVDEASQKVIHV